MPRREKRDFVPESELVSTLRRKGISLKKIKALLEQAPTHVRAKVLWRWKEAGPRVLPRTEPAKIRVKGYSEDDAQRILAWIEKMIAPAG